MIEYKTVLVFGDKNDRVIETVGHLPDGKAFEVGYYNGDAKPKAIINISSSTGCPVGCNFCELTSSGGPLEPEIMCQQVEDMLGYAQRVDGYDPYRKPLKINIAKTGDPVFNSKIPDFIARSAAIFNRPSFKYSTSLPRVKNLEARIEELAQFARNYRYGSIQPQFSLISTSESFRQASVGTRTNMQLAPLQDVRRLVDIWRRANPIGRVPNCSLLVSAETPCDPKDVLDILPPGSVNFRIRKVVETAHGRQNGLREADDVKIESILQSFRKQGYDISDAGLPTPTEAAHGLASNVTRSRVLAGGYPEGVWHVDADGSLQPLGL